MKLAYVINQYPQPSQSFIRREILAHEAAGVAVDRYTLRRFDATLVDAGDIAEQKQTRALLDGGAAGLLVGLAKSFAHSPRRFATALRQAWKNGRTADRGGVLLQLIYLAEAAVLAAMLREKPVDHVHAHFGTNSASVAMLCHLLGGPPYSFTVHGPEEFDRAYGEGLALSDKVGHAKFTVVISEFGRGQMMRWTDSRDWERLQIVRCGVDAAFLDAERRPAAKEPIVLCIGRLVEQKGQLLLVRAIARLRDRGVMIQLRLIGDGPMRGDIENFVRQHDLADRVSLLGSQSATSVREHILQSRIVVQASLAEGLPVAIMEALALERCVIATQIAAVPELVDSQVGWIIPAGSVELLADALQTAVSSDDLTLERMGEVGRSRVLERHSATREAQSLRTLIAQGMT